MCYIDHVSEENEMFTYIEMLEMFKNIKQETLNTLNESKPSKDNKGYRGQVLEKLLGLKLSSALTDLIDGELKTFTIKESISISMLKHLLNEIVSGVKFEDSTLFRKMVRTIYVGFDKDTGIYQGYKGVDLTEDPELFNKMKEDYEFICEEIRRYLQDGVQLETINGPNMLLQIRTKASKKSDGTYTPLKFNGEVIKNKSMSFFVRASYGRSLKLVR